MIFAVESLENELLVHVYDDQIQLSNSLEWQDVYGNAYKIVDESGVTYEWDSSRQAEFGTLYGYTLINTGHDPDLAKECSIQFSRMPGRREFSLKPKALPDA